MKRKLAVFPMAVVAMSLLLGTSVAQETEVILDVNGNVVQILNLEVCSLTDQPDLYHVEFKYGTAVDVFGDGETLDTFDFDFPSSNDIIFCARSAVDNALNSNDPFPQGAGEESADEFFIPSIFENDLAVLAAGGENVAGVWSSCLARCFDFDPDLGSPGYDPNLKLGIAVLSPIDNETWADFTLVSEVPPPPAGALEGTTHRVQLRGPAVEYAPDSGFVRRGSGSLLSFAAVLRTTRSNGDTGGFDYSIKLLADAEGNQSCAETTIGTLSTYSGESEAFGSLSAANFPETGDTPTARFFAKVQTTPGATGFRSVSGWFEINDGTPPDPDQISRRFRAKAKETTPAELGLQCTVE